MTLGEELVSAKSHYHQNMLLLEWYVGSIDLLDWPSQCGCISFEGWLVLILLQSAEEWVSLQSSL